MSGGADVGVSRGFGHCTCGDANTSVREAGEGLEAAGHGRQEGKEGARESPRPWFISETPSLLY